MATSKLNPALEQLRDKIGGLVFRQVRGKLVVSSAPDFSRRKLSAAQKAQCRRFADAVRHELDLRRREELRRSLRNPHPEGAELADEGLAAWTRSLPEEDAEALVDSSAGKPVRWVAGEGWVEERE